MARAVALYRFDAAQPGDLSFEKGEVLTILEQRQDGWWKGQTNDGRVGVFPYNRVKIEDAGGPQPMTAAPAMVFDRVQKVNVAPAAICLAGTKFNVTVDLFNGATVRGEKTMDDFRALAHAVDVLTQQGPAIIGFDRVEGKEVALPLWSDNMEYPQALATVLLNGRGEILTSFMQNIYNDLDSEGAYLMVFWLDPNHNFSLSQANKRKVEQALQTGTNNAIAARNNRGPDPQMARALYRWAKNDDQDNIEFQKGEIFAYQEDSEFQGWWIGTKINGDQGLFPFNYVETLSPSEATKILYPEQFGVAAPAAVKETFPTIMQPAFTPQNVDYKDFDNKQMIDDSKPRHRQKISKYTLCCTEAFDELLTDGVTIEEDGKLALFDGVRDTPQTGDLVRLDYSAYIWEPQKQELLEFSSSDKLINRGASSTEGPLEFEVGADQAIDGLDEAVRKMSLGQKVRVTLAPHKAYDDVGNPPEIPGNAYLVYDITLKNIKRDSKNVAGAVANVFAARKPAIVNRPKHEGRPFMGAASARNLRNSPRKSSAAVGGVSRDHFKKKLTLVKLQEIVRMKKYTEYGIDPAVVEEYLTETEFDRAFKIPYEMFLLLPATRRRDLKKRAGIF